MKQTKERKKELISEFNKLFVNEPYVIIQLDKNLKKAIKELKLNNCTHYVYLESPFQYRFIGVCSYDAAKDIYDTISNNNDLYGCVLSIEECY